MMKKNSKTLQNKIMLTVLAGTMLFATPVWAAKDVTITAPQTIITNDYWLAKDVSITFTGTDGQTISIGSESTESEIGDYKYTDIFVGTSSASASNNFNINLNNTSVIQGKTFTVYGGSINGTGAVIVGSSGNVAGDVTISGGTIDTKIDVYDYRAKNTDGVNAIANAGKITITSGTFGSNADLSAHNITIGDSAGAMSYLASRKKYIFSGNNYATAPITNKTQYGYTIINNGQIGK
ncbi:hypothetical protein [Phascolarctobacterium sp.]|uniref:hypothetical protein n=1 Tax=Phascolarctobacterium sp. TaxID=2049039 RepID=UPI0038663D79